MSASSKPIFRQPGGGRGRLLAPVTGRSYDGTYELPNGKFDRRIFKQPSNAKAVKAYEEWCKEMDERILRAMQEKVRPKKKQDIPQEVREEKGAIVQDANKNRTDLIYVVMVVGGVAVAWCETFDKAAAVCDALTLGAKASGFAASYDVVEVKKWTA